MELFHYISPSKLNLAETFYLNAENIEVGGSYIELMNQSLAHVSSSGTLTARFRARCGENLYGDNCSSVCIPRDDNLGHYVCDEDGERVCSLGFCNLVENCTVECDECESNPCQNGGNCTVSELLYKWGHNCYLVISSSRIC